MKIRDLLLIAFAALYKGIKQHEAYLESTHSKPYSKDIYWESDTLYVFEDRYITKSVLLVRGAFMGKIINDPEFESFRLVPCESIILYPK